MREIIFDHTETNLGNAYDKFTGTFKAPKVGTYAFSWTVFAAGSASSLGEIATELIINGQIHGNSHVDSEVTNDDDMATAFVIKQLDKDDVVFIRSSGNGVPQGTLINNRVRWTFSGWLISST